MTLPPLNQLNALALDTSTEYLSLALQHNGVPVASHYALSRTLMNQTILETIDTLLAGARLTPQDLHLVVVAQGPGSFTGTRIGMAVARTFAQVLGIPLVGVDSLTLLAAQAQMSEGEPFQVLLNCARDELYHAGFAYQQGLPVAQSEITRMGWEDTPALLTNAPALLRRLETRQQVPPEVTQALQPVGLKTPFADGLLLLQLGVRALAQHPQYPQGPYPFPDPIYLKSEAFRKWQPPQR